jgi:hypothetical protein
MGVIELNIDDVFDLTAGRIQLTLSLCQGSASYRDHKDYDQHRKPADTTARLRKSHKTSWVSLVEDGRRSSSLSRRLIEINEAQVNFWLKN